MTKGRIAWIDILKFIGIFLLLIEHTGNWCQLTGNYEALKRWICSFHMPLFFVAYGMALSVFTIKKERYLRFLEKRFQSLLIPYFIWTAIYSVGFGSNFFIGVLYGTNPSLGLAQTNQVLWFLPAIFIAAILYKLIGDMIDCITSSKNIKFFLILIIIILFSLICQGLKICRPEWGFWFGIDIAFGGCSFMLAGSICRELLDFLEKKPYMLCVVMCVTAVVGIIIELNNVSNEHWVNVMAVAFYGKNFFLFFSGAISTIVALSCACILIQRVLLFAWLGENSLFIMAAHYIIFEYTVRFAFNHIDSNILVAVVNAALTTIICIPFIWMSLRWCPILIGKKK